MVFCFLTFVVRIVKKPLNVFLITKSTWSCPWFWFYWSLFTEFEKFLSHATTLTFRLYIFTLRLLELWLVETENSSFKNVCCTDGIKPRGGNPSLHCFHFPLVMFVFCNDIIEHNASDLWKKNNNNVFSHLIHFGMCVMCLSQAPQRARPGTSRHCWITRSHLKREACAIQWHKASAPWTAHTHTIRSRELGQQPWSQG